MSKQATTEAKRVGKFGIIGVLNTLVDYTIFIALTKIFSIPLDSVWTAKLPSGAIAMVFSFVMNRIWVFESKGKDVAKQAATFFPVTMVGVFVIQTGLVQLFSSQVPQAGQLAYGIGKTIGIVGLMPDLFTEVFVIKTVAFGLATLASLSWNYLMYKYVVFRK